MNKGPGFSTIKPIPLVVALPDLYYHRYLGRMRTDRVRASQVLTEAEVELLRVNPKAMIEPADEPEAA